MHSYALHELEKAFVGALVLIQSRESYVTLYALHAEQSSQSRGKDQILYTVHCILCQTFLELCH